MGKREARDDSQILNAKENPVTMPIFAWSLNYLFLYIFGATLVETKGNETRKDEFKTFELYVREDKGGELRISVDSSAICYCALQKRLYKERLILLLSLAFLYPSGPKESPIPKK